MELPDSCYDECFVKDCLSDLFENEEVATNSVPGNQSFTEKVNTSSCGNSVVTTKNQEPITPSNNRIDIFLEEQTTNNFLIKNESMKFIEQFDANFPQYFAIIFVEYKITKDGCT